MVVTSSLRICHVVESGATGTLEMVLLAAETQRVRGHRVTIAYSKRPGTPADLRARVHPGVGLEHLRMRPFIPHLIGWCLQLRRLLKHTAPDVLHLHCSLAGFFGRLVAAHGSAGHVLYSPHCISLMHIDLGALELAVYRALERMAQRIRPAVYLACARPEQEVIARQIGASVRLLENAVQDDLATRFRPRVDHQGELRRVVSCARIAPLKGPETFAEICRAVRAVQPQVEFMWVGDGKPADRAALEEAGVVVTGWRTRDEALRRVADSCVYLSTSRWEGMPVSVLEAMAIGVPVLCRRADWSESIIDDGETGRLFDHTDAAVEALLAESTWRAKVANAAAKVASKRFSEARFASDLEQACRDSGT